MCFVLPEVKNIMKTIKYTLGAIFFMLPLFNYSQVVECTTPEKVFSTQSHLDHPNMYEIESVIIPDKRGGQICYTMMPIEDTNVYLNGEIVTLQSDSLDFDLTTVELEDDRVLYKFENIKSAHINISTGEGLKYYDAKHDGDQKEFAVVDLSDVPHDDLYLYAIIDGEETFQIKILDK